MPNHNLKSAFNLIKNYLLKAIILLSCFFIIFSCYSQGKNKLLQQASDKSQYAHLPTNEWLNAKFPSVEKAILRSKNWLDTVNTNPLLLRKYGIKGKKKLVELFDAYLAIYDFILPNNRESIAHRLEDIAGITQISEYHDMNSVDDKQFDEDATSYLRLCYLLEQKGFKTDIYRQEIQKIIPRLNERMPNRGANQQMTFHWYYRYFHIPEPFPLDKSFANGLIAQKFDPGVMNDKEVYDLTHEIFAIYEYGDRADVDFFSKDDKIYLNNTLGILTAYYIETQNPDLTAELVTCMYLLKMQDEPISKTAIDNIITSQNSDGSFGNYEGLRLIYEDYVREGYYLHTTAVVLKALSLTFGNKNRI